MVTKYQKIKEKISSYLINGGGLNRQFIICPFGEIGMLTKQILNECFAIQESYIIDNQLAAYNTKIKKQDFFRNMDTSEYTVLFTCDNFDVYDEILSGLKEVFSVKDIVTIFEHNNELQKPLTKYGKYSYGPLCNHWLVEEVGAFCSFAPGSDVVENHPVQYISTHAFMYCDKSCSELIEDYGQYKERPWYFPGIMPKAESHKYRRITIGNDVWFGKNVLVTNSSNIGNGVIAAAGAIITKDIPDYAVVAGVPAKIIRYRYSPEQIEALNKIAWWDWSDEKIRECYDDLFEDVDYFIDKYETK